MRAGVLALVVICLGCAPQARHEVDERYLELLQLASHLQQQGIADPGASARYRFVLLRDRLVAEGRLVRGELTLAAQGCGRHDLATCLWLFDSIELGRLSLQLDADGRRVTYWIRPCRERALRQQLERLVPAPTLSRR